MPNQYTKNTIQTTLMWEMQPKLIQKTCKTLSCSLEDFLAKVSVLLENEKDLPILVEHSFLRLQGFLPTKNPNIFYSKMLKVYYLTKGAELSKSYLKLSPNRGMMYRGRYIIPMIMESPKKEKGSILKDILEKSVDKKYYLPYEQLGRIQIERERESDEPLKIATATRKGYDEALPHYGVRLDHPNGTTGRGRVHKDKTGTLNCNSNWGTVTPNYKIRRLTPRECERLQGFDDDYTKYGKDGELISDSQRYKCLGNAVTVNVVEHIMNEWDFNVP